MSSIFCRGFANGHAIHATLRKQLLYLFEDKIVEGEVYRMSHFGVVPNLGSYQSTVHECKLVFQMKTKIQRSESSTIPLYGLSLTKCADLKSAKQESMFLTDIIGLLGGMSVETEYMKDGKKIKMTIIEITDDSGKIECAFFREYAEMLKKMMESAGSVMSVVVLQFTKLKIFKRLVVHGVESNHPVSVIGARSQVSKEDDFLNLFPKQTIGGIKNYVEDGIFVVYGSVTGLVKGEDFRYPACKCHKSVTPGSGSYYCSGCVKHVFQIVPRYRLKMYVCDDIDEAVFVMFDSDLQQLLGKTCMHKLYLSLRLLVMEFTHVIFGVWDVL